MSKKLRALLERKTKALAAANAITSQAEKDGNRDLTAEERTETDTILASINTLNGDIERQRQLDTAEASLAGVEVTDVASVTSAVPAVLKDPKRGFASLGEFSLEVRRAAAQNGSISDRLRAAAPSAYGAEGVGADGGFAVPPEFRDQIMAIVQGEDELLPRTDQIIAARNSLTIPVDETTPWGTSGITAAWLEEAAQKTPTKPALKQVNVRLNKLAALVPMTDELLEDASALASYLPKKAAEKIAFAVNLAIVQGTGAGQPLGILNSPALVSVAKVGSQVADTIVAQNISSMWSRMYAPYRRKAVWLANQDIEPQLDFLMKVGKLDTGAADTGWGVSVPMYNPDAPNGPTLKGRPIVFTQAAETLGDKGDLILADLSQYLSLVKGGGVKSDVSIHLWFDYDITAYRFVLRVGGRPWLSAPIAARDGSATYSSFVTLDERA